MSIFHLSKNKTMGNLEIIGYCVIRADLLIEKDLELSPSPPNCLKDSRKGFALVYIYKLVKFGDLRSFGSKDIFKIAPHLMY